MAQTNVDLIEALRQLARTCEAGTQTDGFQADKNISRQLLDLGLSAADLQHLQNLSDPEVLEHLPGQNPNPAQYLRAWANLLEDQLMAVLDLPVSIRHLQLAA